ncbi:hypothetical protein [Streptomyces marincola]|nr:hypothetical protein [Streptomyces marincola]
MLPARRRRRRGVPSLFLVPQRARVAETIGRDLGAHAGRPVRAWPSTP